MRFLSTLIGVLTLVFSQLIAAQASPGGKQIDNLQQLGAAIDRIANRTHTPGAAIALVLPGGEIWLHTTGMADLKQKRPVAADTRFRIGSISKMFVSLSIMKLEEEGKLDLDDRLADLAPEIEFDNPWEARYPLRLIHLLNHSSGWDAPHFVELAGYQGEPVDIRTALSIHPHSRRSRWAPGTRTAYNNTGPLMAAYIVEKRSGLRYEDFVRQHFLAPLDMGDSGYFYSDDYRSNAATLYHAGRALPYWHLYNRAVGGMHSSLNDMVKFAQLLLRRGQIGNERLLAVDSVARTEHPRQTLAAEAGLQISWGLGNNIFHRNGVVFYGHEGSLPGASAILAYQPELDLAYVAMTNSDGPAMAEIHRLLADYVTRGSSPKQIEPDRELGESDRGLSGFYRVVSPVREISTLLTDLLPWSLTVQKDSAAIRPLTGAPPRKLIAGFGSSFKQDSTGRVVLVKVSDPLVGEVLHYGPMTLKRVGGLGVYGKLLVLALWVLSAIAALLFALVWLPRYLLGSLGKVSQIALRLWPLLAIVSVVVVLIGTRLAAGGPVPYAMAGRISLPSLMVFAGTIAFFACALWSAWVWYRQRGREMNWVVKYHSTLLIVLNLLVGLYLLGYGVIGLRLWA